jgi:glycosyltransferase involved in cell wall biosynthesis
LNPGAGGAEVFTREVARRWVEAGNEVTLFTSEFPGCRREEVLDGVRVVRAGGKYGVYRWAKKFYRKRFSAEGFDVVVDEINTRPFFAPGFVDGRERTVALIHQLAREYWFFETRFPVSYIGYHFLEGRWLRRYVDVPTVTVSESTRKDLVDLGFRRVSVVSEGLNFAPLDGVPEKEGFPVVVFVGRLNRAKRPDHAVRAFSTVREKLPEAELWVVGDGYFRKNLEKIAGSGVKFFGGLDDVKRRELVRRAWVLVNPSVREGWGLNVVEANGLGVPCVAYDVGGLRDSIRDGVTGLLAVDGCVDDLAGRVVSVLQDESFRFELSKKALEYASGFSWDRTAQEFMKMLEQNVVEE